MDVTKHEARILCHWLDVANGNFVGGSYVDIEGLYNKLSDYGHGKRKKKWKWKEG